MRRRWGRRLPRVSQYPNQVIGASLSAKAPDPNTPINYSSNWLELKELLFRIYQLEQSVQTSVVPSSMFNGKQTSASLCLLRWPSTEAFTFPVGLVGSKCIADLAATAQTDLDVTKNGVSFGTIRFAAGGTPPVSATFISSAGASFVSGDILRVIGPVTPDATLGDLGFGLRGPR